MNIENAYYGYIKDNLLSVASGGAATAITTKFIEAGGGVVGVRYTSDYKGAEYCYIDKLEGIEQLKGSKYIFSKKRLLYEEKEVSVYELVDSELRKGKRILFIGLGCDVFGLKHYLKKNECKLNNLYTIDLICHGPTFPSVQEAVVNNLEKKYNSPITFFSVKNKSRGWLTPSLYVKFQNGKTYSKPFYDTDFGYAFDHFSSSGCWNCKYKGKNHDSDLTIGDYWGITERDLGFNKNGVSALISRSEKGEELINSIKQTFVIYSCTLEEIIIDNPMYEKSRMKDRKHKEFERDMKCQGLHVAVVAHRGKLKSILLPIKRSISMALKPSFKRKIKRLIMSK